jgi:hypothetical protein
MKFLVDMNLSPLWVPFFLGRRLPGVIRLPTFASRMPGCKPTYR